MANAYTDELIHDMEDLKRLADNPWKNTVHVTSCDIIGIGVMNEEHGRFKADTVVIFPIDG